MFLALTPRNWVILYAVLFLILLVWSLVSGKNMFKKANWDNKPVVKDVHPVARQVQEIAYSDARGRGLTTDQARAHSKAVRSLWETDNASECVGYSTIPYI